jgi:hypothetical protein
VPARFDLLSVDVERHDYEVLSSLDFEAFRPRVIVVEVLDHDSTDPITRLLAAHGYEFAARGIMNVYFRDTSSHP